MSRVRREKQYGEPEKGQSTTSGSSRPTIPLYLPAMPWRGRRRSTTECTAAAEPAVMAPSPITQEKEQEAESGDVTQTAQIENE